MKRAALHIAAAVYVSCIAIASAQTMAERYPPRVEDLRPTSGWAPEFQRPAVTPARARVPLRVDWGDNELAESVVTFGAPFARGVLPDVRQARIVDAQGLEAPAELRATATWDGPDGPVRWALVHARLQRDRDYFLEYGADVNAVPAPGIRIAESENAIEIDTGPMRVTLSRRVASVVETVALDLDGDGRRGADEELVNAEGSRANLPVVTDGAGTPCHAGGADAGLKVEVVESGPQRAAVRREGWYVNPRNEKFCQFITYTYFYAGQTGFRHDHTLVVAFDSNRSQIRDILLPVPLSLDPAAQAVFAGDATPDGAPIPVPAAEGSYRLVQQRHDAWELSGPGGILGAGARSGGWFGLADHRGGAFGGLRDFWQQCPAELETDAHTLRFHLWPARGVPPLDFRPSAVMGRDYPGNHVFYGDWYRDGLDEMTQAYGLAKTHSLHLDFFAAADRGKARRRIRARASQPVLALPDPKWICDTDVLFGRVHPCDPEQFPEIEAMLDSLVEQYHRQRDEQEQYGWIDFGDVFNTGKLWRRWASMFYGFPNLMPRLYLRSGRRDAWDFHRVNTRHIADIDLCHLDHPGFQKEKGRRYGGNGGICHYAAGLYKTGCDTHLEFLLMDYYINGNLRTWEVANEYLGAHAAMRDEDPSLLAYTHRNTGGALRFFCEGYQATWDPEYLSVMRQIADTLYNAPEPFSRTRYMDVYMNPGKILYYQITGEKRMRELFLQDMTLLRQRRDVHVLSDTRGATMSGPAHAYWFTGDKGFLPFMRWQLDLALERGIENIPGKELAIAATYGYQLPEVMAVLAQVTELPDPAGPALPEPAEKPLALKTNGAYHLLEPHDTAFRLVVDVDLYRGGGSSFPNWSEWVEALPAAEQPALRILDPAGDEIQRLPLTSANTVKPLQIEVPADGKTGTYTLVPVNRITPLGIHLSECSLEKRVLVSGDHWISGDINPWARHRTVYFRVPAGTRKFQLAVKTAITRGRAHYGVANAAGIPQAEMEREIGANPCNDWDLFELDAHGTDGDETWNVTFNKAASTYLKFTGIPGFLASSPAELFAPDPAPVQALPPMDTPPVGTTSVSFLPSDLPWGGTAAFLNEDLVVSSPSGGKLLNEQAGTIELWVKTLDPHSDLSDRVLLKCGSFSLFRRFNVGTYAMIAGTQFQRFFVLPNNRWTHLAFTWQPARVQNADLEIQLFADGVEIRSNRIGPTGTPFRNIPSGWSGEQLILPAGIAMGGVRISETARYHGNFQRPGAPFEPDAQTRLLGRVDGNELTWTGE